MPDREDRLADQRRLQRTIDKQREIGARWLQKMPFALSKAKETLAKLAETTGEDLNPLIALDDGPQVSLDALEDIVHKRVDALMDSLGKSTYEAYLTIYVLCRSPRSLSAWIERSWEWRPSTGAWAGSSRNTVPFSTWSRDGP